MIKIKNEIINRIDRCIKGKRVSHNDWEQFLIYYKLFGFDQYVQHYYQFFAEFEPQVLMIDLDDFEGANAYAHCQIHKKIEVCQLKPGEELKELIEAYPEAEYACFYEKDYEYNDNRIADSILSLITTRDDACFHYRNFVIDGGVKLRIIRLTIIKA